MATAQTRVDGAGPTPRATPPGWALGVRDVVPPWARSRLPQLAAAGVSIRILFFSGNCPLSHRRTRRPFSADVQGQCPPPPRSSRGQNRTEPWGCKALRRASDRGRRCPRPAQRVLRAAAGSSKSSLRPRTARKAPTPILTASPGGFATFPQLSVILSDEGPQAARPLPVGPREATRSDTAELRGHVTILGPIVVNPVLESEGYVGLWDGQEQIGLLGRPTQETWRCCGWGSRAPQYGHDPNAPAFAGGGALPGFVTCEVQPGARRLPAGLEQEMQCG